MRVYYKRKIKLFTSFYSYLLFHILLLQSYKASLNIMFNDKINVLYVWKQFIVVYWKCSTCKPTET